MIQLLLVLVSIVVVLVAVMTIQDKNGNPKIQYDERQTMVMRKAAQRALVVGMLLNMICGLLIPWPRYLPFDPSFILAAIAFVTFLVYVIPCIFEQAYLGIQNQWKKAVLLSGLIALSDLVAGSIQIRTELAAHQLLTLTNSCTLLMGITYAVITICLLVNKLLERQETK